MPSNNKNIIGDLRGKFDPHYKLASNVEGIQKGLGIEVAQIHKTLSKSFVTQRKTLTRVLGLEGRVSDLESQQAAEEQAKEGIDEILNDIHEAEAKAGSTKTKPKSKKKSVAKKRGKKSFSKTKGKVKAGKFFNLAQEVRTQGTLDGKTLTPEQRKAGFKAAKGGADSVGWKQFLDSVEETKETASASSEGITPNTKMLPGSSDMGQGVLEGIATDVKSILGVIDSRTEAEEDAADELKQEKEKDTRKDKEEKKEAKANKKGPLPGFIKKATAPIENILGAIVKTFSLLLAGWGITKLLDWLGNPANAKAVEELKDFITVALPPILKGILALVALNIGIKIFNFAKMLASGSLKLLMGLKQMAIGVAKWAMTHPRLALAMGLGAAAIGLFLSSGGDDTEQGTSDNNIDSEVKLNGGGLVPIQNFKEGGFVSGPGGVDKVPARLTAGEFVMSKGAVQKYGASTLANMNAAGGGTNRPTFSKGRGGFNEGGLAKQGVVTDPKVKKAQEDYMLHWVNKERVEFLGLPPLDKLTYAQGVELTEMMGPGPKTTETINTNFDFDKMLKSTSRTKTRGDETISDFSVGMLTEEDKQQYLESNPSARLAQDLLNQFEMDELGDSISASAKMNGGGLVPIQNFQGGGLVQGFQGGGGVKAIKTANQLINSVPGNSGGNSSGATILPVPSGSGSGNAGTSGDMDNLVMFSPVDGDNLSSLIMKSMYSILD